MFPEAVPLVQSFYAQMGVKPRTNCNRKYFNWFCVLKMSLVEKSPKESHEGKVLKIAYDHTKKQWFQHTGELMRALGIFSCTSAQKHQIWHICCPGHTIIVKWGRPSLRPMGSPWQPNPIWPLPEKGFGCKFWTRCTRNANLVSILCFMTIRNMLECGDSALWEYFCLDQSKSTKLCTDVAQGIP